jgi:hypothetical protein
MQSCNELALLAMAVMFQSLTAATTSRRIFQLCVVRAGTTKEVRV